MRSAILTNNSGNVDLGVPTPRIDTDVIDPVLTTSVLCYVTFNKGPISGFTSADFTLTNCTLSDFTQLASNIWSFNLNPQIDGTFTAKINAGVCTWSGIANLASSTFTRTYDSGASYNLTSSNVAFDGKYRGHDYGVSDCNDLLSATNQAGMELLFAKYNFGCTQMANGNNQANRDQHKFGRFSFGCITSGNLASGNDSATVIPLITTVRQGAAPTVQSYKNGVTDYSSLMLPYFILGRNSGYETAFSTTLNVSFGMSTQAERNPEQSTFRCDYYLKNTNTNYFVGSLDTGITGASSKLSQYIAAAKAAGGWFRNFVHHHWQVSEYFETYLQSLNAAIGSDDVARLTHQELGEYCLIKNSVDSVSASGNVITVNHTKKFTSAPAAPYSNITTPCWVKVDISGTVFAGHDIAASNGLRIRKISSTVFYVPVVLNFNNTSTTVSIGISTSPDYVNLNDITINRSGTTVTTDQPCKLFVKRWAKPTNLGTSVTSMTIPTADNQSFTMTTNTSLGLAVDTELRILADSNNWFYAQVVSNVGTTLTVSCSGKSGSGTFSSWTVQRFFHRRTAADVQLFNDSFDTSFTLAATPDTTNYNYAFGAINRDSKSNVLEQ